MPHVEEDRLLAFTLGNVEPAAAAAIEAHLTACGDCRQKQQAISSGAFSKTKVGNVSQTGVPTRVEGQGIDRAGQPTLQRGATVGRYSLLEKRGSGGMGEVYAAYDPHLDRKVAVKLLRAGAFSAAEGKARLMREAQAMARLQHPNVIAVHDVGEYAERVFIAMEFVDGETLADWFRGNHSWEEVVRVFLQAGSGLAAAHRAGLIHRDFKPDNVLLGADLRPRVVDFGLARQSTTPAPNVTEWLPVATGDTSLSRRLTQDGAVMGTPGYMAPEQIAGLATDARSDQFSFCVALWEGLYGRRPFSGSTLKQHAQEIAAGRITPPPSETQVPAWVEQVARRGLASNPADRFPDMDALLKALRPQARRNPRRTFLTAALLVFSASGIGYGMWTRQRLQVCGGTEQRLEPVWNAARKAKLRSGFVGTGLSYAAEVWTNSERVLDAWSAEWANTARDVCEASKLRKTDSAELYELKNACLDERLQRLEALLALFDSPDHDVVNNAPTAARALESVSGCNSGQLRRAPTVDPATQAADALLRSRLAEARAEFAAGKYAMGATRLRSALDPAASPETLAEASLWLARLELKKGDLKLAHQANLSAAELALKSGEPSLVARALSRLYASEGYDDPTPEADTWKRLASAAAARVPGDWEVQVELSRDDGLVELRRKRYKAALADFEQVLGLQQEHLGAEHPEVASTLNNLGVVLSYLDRSEDAVARYEASLQLHEKLEGPEHPNVASALQNLAVALRRMGRALEARDAFERAVAIRRKALGFGHPDTLRSAQSLIKQLIAMDALDPARALLDEVHETRAQRSGTESAELIPVLELDAELFLAGGYWREALDAATRHLVVAKSHGSSGTTEALGEQCIAWGQLGQFGDARRALAELQKRQVAGEEGFDESLLAECAGRLELAQGRPEAALVPLERAIALREKSSPLLASRLVLALARAQIEGGQVAQAIPGLLTAELRFEEAQAERLHLEAQVLRAQATAISREPERATALETLRGLVPRLTQPQQAQLADWMTRHGAALDAGTP